MGALVCAKMVMSEFSSQYYFVLQSLHKLLPSTTVYYKACTNYFPVLLCTTKLAQTTSQYYCVLQSLHKLLPSTTLHYKACTNYFPVLLCTTWLAQTTSQYYCVLQSLHKALATMRRYECDMSPFLSCSFCFPSISLYVVFKSFLSVHCSFHQGQLDPPKRSETTLKPL